MPLFTKKQKCEKPEDTFMMLPSFGHYQNDGLECGLVVSLQLIWLCTVPNKYQCIL